MESKEIKEFIKVREKQIPSLKEIDSDAKRCQRKGKVYEGWSDWEVSMFHLIRYDVFDVEDLGNRWMSVINLSYFKRLTPRQKKLLIRLRDDFGKFLVDRELKKFSN
jgi:hypothetical protein